MPDLDRDQALRAYDRLKELGLENVKAMMATDSFPMTWRVLIQNWIARGGKPPKDEKDGDD